MSNLRAVANSDLTTRNRTKVYCYCKICNGKLVDPRTKKSHELKYNNSYTNNSSGNNYQKAEEAGDNLMECEPVPEINVPLSIITDQAPEVVEPSSERTHSFLTKKVPIHESENYQKIKKGKISGLVLENLLPNNERSKNDNRGKGFDDSDGDGDSESFKDEEDNDSEDFEDDDEDNDAENFEDDDEDNDAEDFEDDDEDNDAKDFEDDDDEIVNFALTDFEDGELSLPNINIDDNYT